jgi:hypothetical protein
MARWSISKQLPELAVLFTQLRFPSTTTRHPRSMVQWYKLKGSELRVVLPFGHVIFQKFPKRCSYHHLLRLVTVMHHTEASTIEYEDIDRITGLSKAFVLDRC